MYFSYAPQAPEPSLASQQSRSAKLLLSPSPSPKRPPHHLAYRHMAGVCGGRDVLRPRRRRDHPRPSKVLARSITCREQRVSNYQGIAGISTEALEENAQPKETEETTPVYSGVRSSLCSSQYPRSNSVLETRLVFGQRSFVFLFLPPTREAALQTGGDPCVVTLARELCMVVVVQGQLYET
jgi:hypothetical protein